jgi:outer membrane protein OmpA-like peptidoglycan-associated protein
VAAAEANPDVAKYAALDLQAAQKELQAAEAAANNHDDAGVDQPAFLAAQTARLADLRAAAKADDARVAAGQTERDRIQLAARTREVANASNAAAAASVRSAAEQARLQAQIDALNAKPTPRGLVLTLGDVLFDTGKAQLKPGAAVTLDQLAQFLTQYPDRRVQIDGFTDSVGSDSYNESLSQRRADAVKVSLEGRGIADNRIESIGYGKEFPVAGNGDASGRQQNRRVEIVIGGENNAAIASRGG